MPRYYFHLAGGETRECDEIGSDLKDANEAYLEAFEAAQQLSVDLIREHRSPSTYCFEICDAHGRLVFQLPFTEIVGHRPNRHEIHEAAERGRQLASDLTEQIIVARSELQTLWTVLKTI